MLSFSDLINMDEMARKNPDMNPRISAYKQIIEKGYDTDDYFFTFTSLKKVGINPTSTHDTPNGIYCFPATEILEIVHGDMSNVPYVSNAPYIHILKKKGTGIIDPLESYSQSDYKKDCKKLYNMITETKKGRLLMNDEGREVVKEIMDDAELNAKFGTPIAKLWNVTRALSADTYVSTLMGWGGVRNREYKMWYTDADEWDYKEAIRTNTKAKRKDRNKRKGYPRKRSGVSPNAQGWNNLLRQLGYNGFIDRSGSGLIHSNEPTQAVFMTTKAFSVVDMIENKSYDNLNRQNDVLDNVKKLEDKHNIVHINDTMGKYESEIFSKISSSDIRGCNISYHDSKFFISGGGDISDLKTASDSIRFDDVTIKSVNLYGIDYIENCRIIGGFFEICRFSNCDITAGSFKSCSFPNTNIINNAKLAWCRQLKNLMLFNCKLDSCTAIDCSFGGSCILDICIIKNKKLNILNGNISYYQCYIEDVSVIGGKFQRCDIQTSKIKGGIFDRGTIKSSVVVDGKFMNVEFIDSDVQGGDIS